MIFDQFNSAQALTVTTAPVQRSVHITSSCTLSQLTAPKMKENVPAYLDGSGDMLTYFTPSQSVTMAEIRPICTGVFSSVRPVLV